MPDILETIAQSRRKDLIARKKEIPLPQMRDKALGLPPLRYPFEKSLRKEGISFICECKQASPSKGQIVDHFPYLEIAREYGGAGADAISVLTEPKWFKGDLKYLEEISSAVTLPCLRKDFVIDEYMIYEARAYGAAAVLLIVSLLSDEQLKEYIQLTEDLGMNALVECHDATEVRKAKAASARVIGVNNRNLKNFSVDSTNCLRLRAEVGDDCLFVAESGIKKREDVRQLEEAQVDAVLIGETMMLAKDKKKTLESLKYD